MKTETKAMDYTDLRRAVYRCRAQYPFAAFSALGRSWNGRALFSLKLGDQTDAVLLLGGFDGRDGRTPCLLTDFFEKLCQSYEADAVLSGIRIRSVFRDKGVTVLPCVNPDGLAEHRAVNAHGVNLSENFKPYWKERQRPAQLLDDPALFAGPVAESEPETRALLYAFRRTPYRHIMVVGRGQNTLAVRAPESPEQKAPLMHKVLCAVGGFAAEEPEILPGLICGAAEEFAVRFGRPAFSLRVSGDGAAAENRLEEALTLTCLM